LYSEVVSEGKAGKWSIAWGKSHSHRFSQWILSSDNYINYSSKSSEAYQDLCGFVMNAEISSAYTVICTACD
jgi:hypothetical protein